MRKLAWVALPVLLAVGAFWVTYGLITGPRWSLYQMGQGIHDRQPEQFLAYVDLNSVLESQRDAIVDIVLEGQGGGNDDTRRAVSGLLGMFMGALQDQLRRKVAQFIADPDRDNIPSAWTLALAAEVDVNDDFALVTLSDDREGDQLRMGMRQFPAGHWVVTEINPEDLRQLLEKYAPEALGAAQKRGSVTIRGEQTPPAEGQAN